MVGKVGHTAPDALEQTSEEHVRDQRVKKCPFLQEGINSIWSHPAAVELGARLTAENKEIDMKPKNQRLIPAAKTAVFVLAEIKAATEAFDRGEANVFDALDAIVVAVEAYQAAASAQSIQAARRKDVA